MAARPIQHAEPEQSSTEQDRCYVSVSVERFQQDGYTQADDLIAQEVPVALIYNGISHVVMMASPSDLEDFAVGFSLSEGIIEQVAEVYDIVVQYDPENLLAGVEVNLTIAAQRQMELKKRRRNLTGRTGCGLCGAESLQEVMRPVGHVDAQPLVEGQAVEAAVAALAKHQPLQEMTGAFHGAAWCDGQGNILQLREDIGRHNALDKLLGYLRRSEVELNTGFVLVSSRASYEMVYKSSRCGVATLVAVSAPTALALKMAQEAGLNLIGFARPGRHVVYHRTTEE